VAQSRPEQIRREHLTDAEWEHLTSRVFPLLVELKRKARQRLAEKEAGE